MVEQALNLAKDLKGLEQQRLKQREQVACSDLLDYAGSASLRALVAGGCDGCNNTAGPLMPNDMPGHNQQPRCQHPAYTCDKQRRKADTAMAGSPSRIQSVNIVNPRDSE